MKNHSNLRPLRRIGLMPPRIYILAIPQFLSKLKNREKFEKGREKARKEEKGKE